MTTLTKIQLLIAAVCFGIVGFGLGPMVWGSYSAQMQRNANMYGDVDAKRKAGYENAFKIVCPQYAKASWWERQNFSDIAWCKDYLHRLPEASQ